MSEEKINSDGIRNDEGKPDLINMYHKGMKRVADELNDERVLDLLDLFVSDKITARDLAVGLYFCKKVSYTDVCEVCKLYKYGVEKYSLNAYKKTAPLRVINCFCRHFYKELFEEIEDEESGLKHRHHQISNILILLSLVGIECLRYSDLIKKEKNENG